MNNIFGGEIISLRYLGRWSHLIEDKYSFFSCNWPHRPSSWTKVFYCEKIFKLQKKHVMNSMMNSEQYYSHRTKYVEIQNILWHGKKLLQISHFAFILVTSKIPIWKKKLFHYWMRSWYVARSLFDCYKSIPFYICPL